MKDNKYTKSDLLDLGWTEKMIKDLLPEPELKQNPRYGSAAKMKLWNKDIVESVCNTEMYKIYKEESDRRKLSSRKAVETKNKKTKIDLYESIKNIRVKRFDIDYIMELVFEQKTERNIEKGLLDFCVEDAPEEVINRWIVNYIRHNLCEYDDVLLLQKGENRCESILCYI